MPTKILNSPFNKKGILKAFKFGGGANTIIANDDGSGQGYTINSGGGNDTVTGSINDDIITGGTGSDDITGGLGNDTIFGGQDAAGADAAKGKNAILVNNLYGDFGDPSGHSLAAGASLTTGNDTIVGGNGGNNNLYGDNFGTLSLGAGSTFIGGNDTMTGGSGLNGEFGFNNLIGDTQNIFAAGGSGASFTGGNDTLTGGSGANVSNNLVGDVVSVGNTDNFQGGADTLISGQDANDIMIGDWSSDPTGNAVGGADTFVFGSSNGRDLIADFRSGEDTIDLSATGLVWTDLDTNGIVGLDAGDTHVSIVNGSTVIDLGGAAGTGAGADLVTFQNVTGLIETDFDFGLIV